MNRLQGIALGLTLLAAPLLATAGDLASSLPAHRAASLGSVPEVMLNDMDAEARESVIAARRELNDLLQDERAESKRLADAYGELGGLYQVYLVFPAAEACYKNAIQLAPDEFRWLYYAAYLADDSGISELALARYETARKLRPEYKALGVRLGNVRLDLNQLEAAQAEFEPLVDTTGLEAAARYGLGQIALLQRNFETAIDYFTQALAIEPEATRIHYPLARALHALKRSAEAKQHLALRGDQLPTIRDPQIESLEALKIGTRIHFLHAMKAAKKQDFAAAAEAFALGLEREPDNVAARISYARSLYLSGDKHGAHRELEAALARESDNALGLFLLGVLAEEEGDNAAAMDYYRQAVQHIPDHAGANHFLANQYYRQGKYRAAATHYASSLSGEPGNPLVYMPYLGALLQSGAGDQQIMSALETGLDKFPEHPGLQSLQIILLASSDDPRIGDTTEAHRLARQLPVQGPQQQGLLAMTTAATGDFEQAVTLQEQQVAHAVWYMPTETERLGRVLTAYREGKLPPREDLLNAAFFQTTATFGGGPFKTYPTPRPY